jgi:hypothetical protein
MLIQLFLAVGLLTISWFLLRDPDSPPFGESLEQLFRPPRRIWRRRLLAPHNRVRSLRPFLRPRSS